MPFAFYSRVPTVVVTEAITQSQMLLQKYLTEVMLDCEYILRITKLSEYPADCEFCSVIYFLSAKDKKAHALFKRLVK